MLMIMILMTMEILSLTFAPSLVMMKAPCLDFLEDLFIFVV